MSISQLRAEAANTLSSLGFYIEAYETFTGKKTTFTKAFREYRDTWAYTDEEQRLASYWLDICEREEI